MLFPIIAIVAGIAVLVVGADRFVAGAAEIARTLGIPPLLIGIVVVGFGTSAPEILVSATGAWRGATGIALGNAYGSNITNILLILGVCSLITPLRVTPEATRRELPSLLLVTAVTVFLLWDGRVSRFDAIIMLLVFVGCMGLSIRRSLVKPAAVAVEETAASPAQRLSPKMAVLWIVLGLAMMLASSESLVWGAVSIAKQFGVSDLVIGLTIVAVGTSLPELASSIAASRKGEDDLALGNVIGSNIFNSMVVVGIAALIHPIAADPELLTRDMPFMAGATVLLYVFCRFRPSAGRITRMEGAVFVALYVAYTAYLLYVSMTAPVQA